jgi:putative endonuclease
MGPVLQRGDETNRHPGGGRDPSLVLINFDSVVFGKGIPMKLPCVYILATERRGTLYIGVTSDLPKRIWQHKSHLVPGFSTKYQVTKLVWYEPHETMASAIHREKQLKEWRRAWKVRLIEECNAEWRDLYEKIL